MAGAPREETRIRHAKFAELVASCSLSATEAARQVGYSAKWASKHAHKLLKKPHVQALVKQLRDEAAGRAQVNLEFLVTECKASIKRMGAAMDADVLEGKRPNPNHQRELTKAQELLAKLTGHLTSSGLTVNNNALVLGGKPDPRQPLPLLFCWEDEHGNPVPATPPETAPPARPALPAPREPQSEPWLQMFHDNKPGRTVEAEFTTIDNNEEDRF